MNVKTAFLLVFALTFQPILASSESSWYEDPIVWMTVGASAVTAYFVGGKLQQGIRVVLPAMLGSTVFSGLALVNVVLRKFDRSSFVLLGSMAVLATVLIYKSWKTCPQTGKPGCCCGIKPLTT